VETQQSRSIVLGLLFRNGLKQAIGGGIPAGDRSLFSLKAQNANGSSAELEQTSACGTEP
jgi:hypothetical protein